MLGYKKIWIKILHWSNFCGGIFSRGVQQIIGAKTNLGVSISGPNNVRATSGAT